jgi:hypothetical protein
MNLKNEIIKRSPELLLGGGILGFVSAVIMSARATPKAMQILEEGRYKRRYEEYTTVSKVKDVAPAYIPTAAMVLLSTGMLLASDHITRNRYASLLALYSIAGRALSDWDSSTADNVSKKKYHQIKERVLAPQHPPEEVDIVEGHLLFWDPISGRYFHARSVDTVRKIFKDVNLMLVTDEFVPLSELYYQLDMPVAKFADWVGFHVSDSEIEPRFDSTYIGEYAYIQVNYEVRPRK